MEILSLCRPSAQILFPLVTTAPRLIPVYSRHSLLTDTRLSVLSKSLPLSCNLGTDKQGKDIHPGSLINRGTRSLARCSAGYNRCCMLCLQEHTPTGSRQNPLTLPCCTRQSLHYRQERNRHKTHWHSFDILVGNERGTGLKVRD